MIGNISNYFESFSEPFLNLFLFLSWSSATSYLLELIPLAPDFDLILNFRCIFSNALPKILKMHVDFLLNSSVCKTLLILYALYQHTTKLKNRIHTPVANRFGRSGGHRFTRSFYSFLLLVPFIRFLFNSLGASTKEFYWCFADFKCSI